MLRNIWNLLCFVSWARLHDPQQQQILGSLTSPTHQRTTRLNFSSPAPLLFASTASLLSQLPNAIFPNGHTLALCEIPPLTPLYHGRIDNYKRPESPEWLALDIEMAYGIMGSHRNSHIITYHTTRPVGCLYFDGSSAAWHHDGSYDTQLLLAYGNITGPLRNSPLDREYELALALCNWISSYKLGGPGWGIEAIMRMNAGYEFIWCNFSSPSLRMVSHLNISLPLLERDDAETMSGELERLGDPRRSSAAEFEKSTQAGQPFYASSLLYWYGLISTQHGSQREGIWRSEDRIKLDQRRLINLYNPKYRSRLDTQLKIERVTLNLTLDGFWRGPKNLEDRATALTLLGQRRQHHRLHTLSQSDIYEMQRDVKDALGNPKTRDQSFSYSMDWQKVINGVMRRYAAPLTILVENMRDSIVSPRSDLLTISRWLSTIRLNTHAFYLPFFDYGNALLGSPSVDQLLDLSSTAGNDAYQRCRYQATTLMNGQDHSLLDEHDAMMKTAVEDTLGGICSSVLDVSFAVERRWLQTFNDNVLNAREWQADLKDEILLWKYELEELVAWLGWVWRPISCKEECKWDEKCYIPIWPLMKHIRERPGTPESFGQAQSDRSKADTPVAFSNKPFEPKCVKADFFIQPR